MAAFLSIFITVFLAELGDKTQLATVLFASDSGHSKWMVFLAAAAALTLSTAAAVLLGAAADRFVSALPLKLIAGAGFILIGALMVIEHFRAV
ncbi:TMEM165/GDT1 family protein [Hyphococcus sp. DH-69]|uniref:TMEM165/GDT1 family protein n=1 Tax=Hyphococcus formosus TaxID=3143534 RepID=UPI00398AB612